MTSLFLTLAFAAVGVADDGTPIFDGKTLDGWDGNPAFWSVQEGVITGRTTKENPTKGNTFLIWRAGTVDDFELTLDYKIVGGNSGIQYRSIEKPNEWGRWVIGGPQADFEAGDTYSGILYDERGRGILALRGQETAIGDDGKPKLVRQFADTKELQGKIKKEDWNTYRVVAKGREYTHMINGETTARVTDNDPKNFRRSGLLALQLHAGPPMTVQFRNIRLKRLKLEDAKKVVMVAGRPSHGWGDHEHNAGCRLLAKSLAENKDVKVVPAVYHNGWPKDPTAFDNADGVVFYCDGGAGHVVVPHLDEFDKLMKKGVGLVCLHYGVEVDKGKPGDRFLDWIGGYFEAYWSVNPHWTADFSKFPDHPITRGVKPFKINDEWYYHMRFRPDMKQVTPILTAVPPDSTRERDWGKSHGGNAAVVARRGQPEHVAWACEREDGGRGFGFTGAHFHWNWGNDDFRKIVLNAIVWTAKGEVPANGVISATPTREKLETGLDKPKPGSAPTTTEHQKKAAVKTQASKKKAAKRPIERVPPTIADVAYGTHPRHKIDFWKAPSDKPTPLLLFIHGGGWMGGDKNSFGTKQQLKPYMDAGISVAAINYRFILQAMDQKVEPPVKAPLHDAARALQFIRSKATEWNIDKTRVAASGGSAGACSSLWLAFHDDLADPKSDDPIARESTRLTCAAVNGAQTSLDPKQVREWIPNAIYAGHAFGFSKQGRSRAEEFELALTEREKLIPWIKEYSPIELVTKDDPPIYMDFAANAPPPPGELAKDPTHSSIYGVKLAEKMKELGLEVHVAYNGAPGGPHPGVTKFVISKLTAK
jgi:acetyl esterase/lipase/type 1 glutamine amidotransferase